MVRRFSISVWKTFLYHAVRLARNSHQGSTTAADTGMSTALRSVGLLDVVSTTPPGPSVARLVSTPVSTTSLRTLVRIAGYLNRLRKKSPSPRTPRRKVSTTAFTGWRGHGSFGAVPERYASRSVCGHAVVARNPDSGSISANSIPSGGRSVKGPDPG